MTTSFAPAVLLPPARSPAEHRERVSAFWSVFVIDRCWSVATGLPSSLPDDEHPQLKICSVWPWGANADSTSALEAEGVISRESADYTSLGLLFERDRVPGGSISGAPSDPSSIVLASGCTKALKAKAAALFERAARISSMQSEPTYWDQFGQLEYAIGKFTGGLKPFISARAGSLEDAGMLGHEDVDADADTVDTEMALVHTLAHAALIQLHHPRAQKDAAAHGECVRAAALATRIARRLLQVSPLFDVATNTAERAEEIVTRRFSLVDPVIGTCWMCVADVLLREKEWGGDMECAKGMGRPEDDVVSLAENGRTYGVVNELETVMDALKRLSVVFPVARKFVSHVLRNRLLTDHDLFSSTSCHEKSIKCKK
jgi:hypothetical protein